MQTLPAPSKEQREAADAFCAGDNVVVTAVAGAGKTTLLTHICERYSDEDVVVIAYNAPLAKEMNDVLEKCGLMRAKAYTFHGLASHAFRLCLNDAALHEVVREARAGHLARRVDVAPAHLLLDEMQDMRDVFFELLRVVIVGGLDGVHTLLCGDAEQMLYDFEEDDPARLDYLREPERFFGARRAWRHTRLSVSYRLTPPLVDLVNALKPADSQQLVSGNLADAPHPPPVIVTCGIFEWCDKLLPILHDIFRRVPYERTAILVRTVKTTHAGTRMFVNALTNAGVPIYVHGVDAPLASVRRGKVTVCTHYAAKGLTFDACITLGVGETSDENPTYVALSRARRFQVVVLDRRRPPRRLLRSLADGTVRANLCPQTRAFVQFGYEDPEESVYAPSVRDVTAWSPRGRAAACHAAVRVHAADAPSGAAQLTIEPVATTARGETEEVSRVYVLAALCAEENAATGRCRRLEQLLAPQRVSARERRRRLETGDSTRMVEERATDDELLPPRARACLRDALAHADEPAKWCAVAVASACYGEYHHTASRLLPDLSWVDAPTFATVRARVAACVGDASDAQFDVVLRHVGDVTLTQCRCHLLRGATAFSFVYADTLSDTLCACTPAVLAPDRVDVCRVINVRTDEAREYLVVDREAFATRMEL